jgi:CheY-like chemotaxis protein
LSPLRAFSEPAVTNDPARLLAEDDAMTEEAPLILLVDDEQKFLNTIADRIRLKGYKPLLASSGAEALEIARQNELYAAVVDFKMPDMDGLETINRLKKIHPAVKTVLLTGFGDEKVREAARALDTAYFEKDDMVSFWDFIKLPVKKKFNILLVDDEKKFWIRSRQEYN